MKGIFNRQGRLVMEWIYQFQHILVVNHLKHRADLGQINNVGCSISTSLSLSSHGLARLIWVNEIAPSHYENTPM